MTTAKPRKTAPVPERTKNRGWTKHAALRNRAFLYSVIPHELDGVGFSVTLTVKHCSSSQLWAKWRKNFVQALRDRYDLTRFHIVTEWQRRGAPHLHMAVWFGAETARGFGDRKGDGSATVLAPDQEQIWRKALPFWQSEIVHLWLKVAKQGEPAYLAQDVKEIPEGDALHWLRYLAKHGSRSVNNYQRNSENIPLGWEGGTGQVWNKGGDWPTMFPLRLERIEQEQKYQFRRHLKNYLASCPESMRIARKSRAEFRRYWAGYLQSNDATKGRTRPISSFVDLEIQVRILKNIAPDAQFINDETGEIFDNFEDMGISRSSTWVRPKLAECEIDSSALFTAPEFSSPPSNRIYSP